MNDGNNGPNVKYGRNGGRKQPELVFRRTEVVPQQTSNQTIFTNIQQIKDIYLQDTEKVSKEKLESAVLGYSSSSDSLQMSPTLGTLVSDEALMSLHSSESIGGLGRRLNLVQNLDESSSSTCDISELNATITPVTLMDETDGLMMVGQANIKDVFSVPKPLFKHSASPPKDSKYCSQNVITSNRIMDKMIQNCKIEPNFTMPLRVSEFGKVPHFGVKPNFNTIKSEAIYDKINCTTPMLVDVSRQDLRPIDTIKNSFIVGHPAIMTTSMPNHEQQYCLATNTQMQYSQSTNTVIAQASTKDVFLNANCIVSPSHSRNTMLSIAEHNTKRENKNSYQIDGINKRANANETMLLHPETLYAASTISSSHNDSSQNLNCYDSNMLSQINELASQTAKDSRSFRQVDILLSQLQPNDEGVLSLGPLPNSLTADMCQHSATSAEQALNVSMAIEPNQLAELPPSHLLNTISSDFLDSNSVISKTSPGQQTFLPNLSTTTDLALSFSTNFLENSNMSIDMGSLSEGEGSLNISHSFVESLDQHPNTRKLSTEVNFTNALKDAADKYDSVKLKLLAENLDSRVPKPACGLENKLSVPIVSRNDTGIRKRRKVSPVKVRSVSEAQRQKEIIQRNEDKPLVQQVQCLKCSACSFLSLDEAVMSVHMKSNHSKEDKIVSNSSNVNTSKLSDVRRELGASTVKMKTTRVAQPVKSKTNFVHSNSNSSDSSEADVKDEPYSPNDDDTNESNSTNEEDPSKHEMPIVKATDEAGNYKCGVDGCTFKMKEKSNIEYHRKCHSNAFLVCPECHYKFAHWAVLAIHLWKEHYIDMELHTCELCDYKSYSYTKLINNHWSTHSSEKPFLCDVCGRGFKTAKQLRSHKTVHQERKEKMMHKCDMCDRQFTEKRMLLSHLEAVHNKVKPYLCNFCGTSFASKSTLILHIRKHTGEKPFACDECDYRTSDHNSIRRHKMKHSNDKRYSCPYCEYSSIQSSTFKVHLKRKHDVQAQKDGLIFTCTLCTFKTVKRDNFLAHLAIHHKNTDNQDKVSQEKEPKEPVEKPNTKKRKRQGKAAPVQTIQKSAKDDDVDVVTADPNQCQQAYYVVQMPQVININWDAAETVELSSTSTDLVNGVILPGRGISGQIVQLGSVDDIEPTVAQQGRGISAGQIVQIGSVDDIEHTMLQQVEVNNGYVQLTPEVIAVPITNSNPPTSNSSVPGILYLTCDTKDTPSSST